MDPLHNPLREHEYVPTNEQGSLFEVEDMPSVEYTTKANAAWNQANQKVTQWREQSLDLVTVFDDRFPSRLRSVVDVPPFLFAKGSLLSNDLVLVSWDRANAHRRVPRSPMTRLACCANVD